jgi:hypothetical protein
LPVSRRRRFLRPFSYRKPRHLRDSAIQDSPQKPRLKSRLPTACRDRQKQKQKKNPLG